MPRAEIRYSPSALNDLDEIWDHIALSLGNLQAAEHAVGAIISAISRLSIFPDSGSPLAALYPINTGYRYVVSGNYLAFYRHMGGCVYIDRIFYSGSDWIERLFSS